MAILPALVFLAAHHALAKGALFLGTGAFGAQIGPAAKLAVTLALLLPAFVLAGLPASSGGLGKEALKTAFNAGSPVWLPWLTIALSLSGVATTLLMARYVAMIWRHQPKAPEKITQEAVLLPFLALAAASLALPLVWAILAPALATPISQAALGALWPVACGVALATGVAIYAHAQRIGPGVFLSQIMAPAHAFSARTDSLLAAKRRAARRMAYAMPKAAGDIAARWRLGQTAIAGLIALTLALETGASLRGEAAMPPVLQPDNTLSPGQDLIPDVEP